MRKRHDEKMRAMHDAGNDRIRLAKVRLGMTRRVRQRHEHLPQTKVPFANVILHDRLLAREAMFVTKTLEDPLRRVPLLAVNRAILFQNAVDDIRERRQLRALRRLASPISRRFRMQQYLGNRLAIDPELARSFPSAQALTMTRQSHSSIKIHSVHPPPSIRSILTKAIDGPILVRRRNRTNRPLHWGLLLRRSHPSPVVSKAAIKQALSVVTVRQVANAVGCDRRTVMAVRDHGRRGRWPGGRLPKRWRHERRCCLRDHGAG